MKTYDAIVLGAGAMGSAAAYYLAKAGQHVLLLEQFEIDHRFGSSWGYTRIIRYVYNEPRYIQLMRETFPLWHALEAESGQTLYIQTGGIDFGHPEDPRLQETINSVISAGIEHELLSATEAQKRFAQFKFHEETTILYQADSGIITPSRGVKTHVDMAKRYGAVVQDNTPILKINILNDSVEVQAENETFSAGKLIITAGSWAGKVLAESADLHIPLQPLRCQEAQFLPDDGHLSRYDASEMPVYIYYRPEGLSMYGLPSYEGTGVKSAFHGGQLFSDHSEINYTPSDEAVNDIRTAISPVIPSLNEAKLALTRICLYTMTPDEHFIIDQHPEHAHVVIGAGGSGHAFKFSTLIGKMLSDLAIDGATPHDTSLFKITRFQ